VAANPVDQGQSIRELVDDMSRGKVELLVILGGNPVYDAPADLGFAESMKSKVPLRVHLGLYQNETAELCQWHVNETHYLESWSDARAYDGTASIVQPLIAPLYAGKSSHELLALFTGQGETTSYQIVRAYWQKQRQRVPAATAGKAAKPSASVPQNQPEDFEIFWRRAVHDGFIEGTAFPVQDAKLQSISFKAQSATAQGLELNFRRDPSIYDGRFSNNGWLQELPKPMTKVTWDNPLLVAPATANRLQLKTNDLVELDVQGRKARAAVWIQAGQPDNVLTAFLGYGRTRSGRAG